MKKSRSEIHNFLIMKPRTYLIMTILLLKKIELQKTLKPREEKSILNIPSLMRKE